MGKKKNAVRLRWIEAAIYSVAAAAGVVQAIPPGTSWWRVACLMLAAGLPVLLFQLRHGGADPVANPPAALKP